MQGKYHNTTFSLIRGSFDNFRIRLNHSLFSNLLYRKFAEAVDASIGVHSWAPRNLRQYKYLLSRAANCC